jgi:hypothetical protein
MERSGCSRVRAIITEPDLAEHLGRLDPELPRDQPLSDADANRALTEPSAEENMTWDANALDRVLPVNLSMSVHARPTW